MSDTLQPETSDPSVRGGIAIKTTGVVKPTLSRVPFIGRINRAIGGTSERWARALVIRHLSSMTRGHLLLIEGDREWHMGEAMSPDSQDSDHSSVTPGSARSDSARFDAARSDAARSDSARPISATIVVEDPAVFSYIALNGVVGAAEAYMDGHWTTPDLVQVVRFMVYNMTALKDMDKERSVTNKVALSALDLIRRNSVSRARKNISAHYDLGNDFFELFLDPTMMYSSALFDGQDMPLAKASLNKLDTICRKLRLNADDHLLEIGTGWGGMSLYAASNYGCRVTTTTLSQQQHDFTQAAVARANLQDRVTVVMQDYRELTGSYDKLVSIEMIEAVGHQYFSDYFRKCSELLKPDGLMALQAITIADQRYDQARKSVDFIQRYIFPGGCLPSLQVIAKHVAEDTDMCILTVSDMAKDYATTLSVWRQSFSEKIEQIKALGFSDQFIRMWMYYLCYCEGGFEERVIGATQIVIAKPDYRPG